MDCVSKSVANPSYYFLAARHLKYDRYRGVFTWKKNGKEAGSWFCDKRKSGEHQYYQVITLRHKKGERGKTLQLHRLAWFMEYNVIPDVVDHIEHPIKPDPFYNRISNLRNVDSRTNAANKRNQGISKYVGVTKSKEGRWIASIIINGCHVYIGRYKDENIAALNYWLVSNSVNTRQNKAAIRSFKNTKWE